MQGWVPLFNIFLHSPTPETEAALLLRQSFDSSSASSIAPPMTCASFLSLLMKSYNVFHEDGESSTPLLPPSPSTNTLMFIETLPSIVQSRILSFLAYDYRRFCSRELSKLARKILSGNKSVDFWVQRAASILLGRLSDSNYEWISSLSLDSGHDGVNEQFESLPIWLDHLSATEDFPFPWLPASSNELDARTPFDTWGKDNGSSSQVGENVEDDSNDAGDGNKIGSPRNVYLGPEIEARAIQLRGFLMDCELASKAIDLANEIQKLCLESCGNAFSILGLIEPWKANDMIVAVLISNLSNGMEKEHGWPSQVLSSVVLPKMLVLEKPASRVLTNATIEFCRLHPVAAEHALLFPMILRSEEGLSSLSCEVINRVLKESLHPGHVSALFHKLLCSERGSKRHICLPCHEHLISDQLVWNEALFSLLQSILIQKVHLTQESVNHLVERVRELAEQFTTSLRFSNFLLHFVDVCGAMLRSHKLILSEAAEKTNTLVTKALLSRVARL